VSPSTSSPLRLAFAGLLSLAVAMGFGRFAYTPILPAMVAGLHLTKAQSGWLASANFAGYLIGALAGAFPLKGSPRAWMLGGLGLSVATTLGMGLTSDLWLLAALRFAGGLASAAVLIFASTLVLAELARSGRASLSALHFGGVGAGVAISGALVSAMEASGAGWAGLWLGVGALGAVMALAAALLLPAPQPEPEPEPAPPPAPAPLETGGGLPRGLPLLALAYGLFGFGYVVTATFLMVIVRASPEAKAVEPVVWVVVGLAALPSVWAWNRFSRRIGLTVTFALACLVEAVGVAVSVLWPTVPGALLAATALGGTYMAVTALGLALARALAPGQASRALSGVTAAFALGQMIGPIAAGALAERTGGFTLPSLAAAGGLVSRPPLP
jgi:MFS family permease